MSNNVPTFSLPSSNRRVLLVKRPAGIPQKEDFCIDEVPTPSAGQGELLVRNIYLSVDPAQRGWANESGNYAPPVPLGASMRALAVGRIIESRCSDIATGDYVYGWMGWQDYAVIGPAQLLTRIGAPAQPLSAYAGVLGINGLTAYLALSRLGRPVAGEVVLVSTAAGAVGSIVGQLAREAGCHVVGLTGDDDKAKSCTTRFGYHTAINYKTVKDIGAAIRDAAPGGVDVFYDSVGGSISDAAVRTMRAFGRIIQCGTAATADWSESPTGLRNEREVLTRRLTWSGFVIFDHLAEFRVAIDALAPKIACGSLVYEEDIVDGIEAAPDAIRGVYAGENRGKKLIFVG